MDEQRKYLYEEMPVRRSVANMAIPTVISQLISMIYNMADTFFIGQLEDPNQVAAVSVVAPVALVLTALANLFGIGGASLFSRCMGEGSTFKAKQVTAFSFYCSIAIAVFVSLLTLFFDVPLLRTLGADINIIPFASEYMFWVISLGALPSLLSMVLAHFIRADGMAKLAGIVLSAGGIMNLILDPLFILEWGLGMGIRGAAIATLISNIFTFLFFIGYFIHKGNQSVVSFAPAGLTLSSDVGMGVIGSGLPGMLQTLLASFSNAVLNNMAGAFGGTAIAALGVVKKLDQIPMSVTIGIAQGVVPLVGYNYSNKNNKRVEDIVRFALIMAIGFSVIFVAVYELFPKNCISIFIDEAATLATGVPLLRIMCISTPLMAVAFIMISFFQATGKNRVGTILSVMRKGAIDIPLMLVLGTLIPLKGLAFVQPVTETLAMFTALVFYAKIKKEMAMSF